MAGFDPISAVIGFAGGATIAGFAAFASGFLGAAGTRAWEAVETRHFPKPVAELEVPRTFTLPDVQADRLAWVSEANVVDRESLGWVLARHPRRKCPVYQRNRDVAGERRDFLMIRPAGA